MPDVLRYEPIGLEGFDRLLVEFVQRKHLHPEDIKVLPAGGGWLIAEFGADTSDDVAAKARPLAEEFGRRGREREAGR